MLDTVELSHFGTAAGDFSPRRPAGLARMSAAAEASGIERLVRLRVDFTDHLADRRALRPVRPRLWETIRPADGLVLAGDTAGAISSADCATGVLVGDDGAVVMHLGLACVFRPVGAPTVLSRAVARVGGRARLWVGAAIGPCCYGWPNTADNRPKFAELRRRWGAEVLPGRVVRGPRAGAIAIDHRLIVARHAAQFGVQVEVESTCTACRALEPTAEFGAFFSNTRDVVRRFERNLIIARLAV